MNQLRHLYMYIQDTVALYMYVPRLYLHVHAHSVHVVNKRFNVHVDTCAVEPLGLIVLIVKVSLISFV